MKNKHILTLGLTGALSASFIIPMANETINQHFIKADDSNSTLDIKNLKDGTYSLPVTIMHAYNQGAKSMSDGAINHNALLTVDNGNYSIQLTFVPLNIYGQNGYLGDLQYFDNGTLKNGEIISYYSEQETDKFFDVYKKNFPTRNAYPKTISIPVNKNDITNNTLKIKTQVFVPVMEAILAGQGTQNCLPTFDFNAIKVISQKESQLTTLKEQAKNTINNFSNLDDKQKEKFKNQIDSATTKNDIDKILNDAKNFTTNDNNIENVIISVTDGSAVAPHVRRAVESSGKIITRDEKKYLVVSYYSKLQNGIYDSGLREVFYSYDELNPETDTQKMTKITNVKTIENGKLLGENAGDYTISEIEIPLENNNKVYLYGKSLVNPHTNLEMINFGYLTWHQGQSPTKSEKLDDAKFLLVKPLLGTRTKKEGDNSLQFDFEKNGINYSPYNNPDGTKFKLAEDGRYSLELIFERKDFTTTDVRHLKYTLDGSEPTMNSLDASISFTNKSPYKPDKYYEISLNPLTDIANFNKNGDIVTVKVKAFNADGSKSSETQTIKLPFDSLTIDEINKEFNIFGTTLKANISTDKHFGLTEQDDFIIEEITDETILLDAKQKAKNINLNDFKLFKVKLLNNKNNFEPALAGGWNADYNPIVKLELMLAANNNTQSYLYGTELKLLPTTYSSYSKKLALPLNSNESYILLGEQDSKQLLTTNVEKLKELTAQAKTFLENSATTSDTKAKLQQELANAEKTLKRKTPALAKVITHIDNIDKLLEKINNDDSTINNDYYKNNANKLLTIVDSNIINELLATDDLNDIKNLASDIKNSLDSNELPEKIKNLEQKLNNVTYKYPTQQFNFEIRKYHDKNSISMANAVFNNTGRLIFTPEKTYAEIELKGMTFANINSHLLELILFKNELDGEKFIAHKLNIYDDANTKGKAENFDKKILVELDSTPKKEYVVRVDNDGMPNAKPEARFIITSDINRPDFEQLKRDEQLKKLKEQLKEEIIKLDHLTPEQQKNYLLTLEQAETNDIANNIKNTAVNENIKNKLEQERTEKERAEKERAEKERIEKERIEKQRAEKERIEKERTKKERAEKERAEKERAEKERVEKERIEKERVEKERAEKELAEKELAEKQRAEKERIEKERAEKERIEKERIEKERIEKERIEKERIEKERIEKERIEKERTEKERAEKELAEKERTEKERIEKERAEKQHTENNTNKKTSDNSNEANYNNNENKTTTKKLASTGITTTSSIAVATLLFITALRLKKRKQK